MQSLNTFVIDGGDELFGSDVCASCTNYEASGGDMGPVSGYSTAPHCNRGLSAYKYSAKLGTAETSQCVIVTA